MHPILSQFKEGSQQRNQNLIAGECEGPLNGAYSDKSKPIDGMQQG
ncbi:hypothetical protein LINPERPRIM_LOCUS33381 [Linum perenne]